MNSSMPRDTNLSVPQIAALVCHPDARSGVVRRIDAGAWRTPNGALAITYALRGDSRRVRVPAPRLPRRADLLWQHTCFEAFIALKGGRAYYELNFAPSGEWAAYAFRRYREEVPLPMDDLAPKITTRRTEGGLEVDVLVGLDRLADTAPRAKLRLALAAVIEEEGGDVTYWALKHPEGKPDFHHPEGFTLELAPPQIARKRKPRRRRG
ncbi:MAG: DOMON-like domain-containing protein [Acidiferrobacterales bacterium]|nr:DOMON-like domain-containing protein [Acidiferrobacterales bacterium]